MAQATDQSFINGQAESSTAATLLRNDDPFTQALRSDPALFDLSEITHLNRTLSPAHDTRSSLASTSTAAVFSVRDESTVTKPTSIGTPYPSHTKKDKGKTKAPYASSLSVAYGSGSEAEAERHAARHDALLATGGWTEDGSAPLKGAARAKERGRNDVQSKPKKLAVNFKQPAQAAEDLSTEHNDVVIPRAFADEGPDQTSLRRRATLHDHDHDRDRNHIHDQVRLAEEGCPHLASSQGPACKPLSPTRVYVLIGLAFTMMFTVALSAFAAHHTGKTRLGCTKGIVFGTTVLIAMFTFLAMLVARRALQEALLAGLVEIIVGFMLLAELNDFM